MTPDQVHYGQTAKVHAARQKTLDYAFRANPNKSPPRSGSTRRPKSSTPKPNLADRQSHCR
jgi:hypothetical protein